MVSAHALESLDEVDDLRLDNEHCGMTSSRERGKEETALVVGWDEVTRRGERCHLIVEKWRGIAR